MGAWARVARLLALEALAAAPAGFVFLTPGLDPMAVIGLGAASLGLGYLLLRVHGSWPLEEGAWLGLAVGGGIGLAEAQAALVLIDDQMSWVRPWLISLVACSGVGIALGFLARYDQHHRLARAARPDLRLATPRHFARLK